MFCNFTTGQGKPCKNGPNCHLHASETVTCSICLNPARKTRGVKDLTCGHRFHKRCIDEWCQRSESCPMCRTAIPKSKYKVSITIENTEQSVSNTLPIDETAAAFLLYSLRMVEDYDFGTTVFNMDIDSDRDMEIFIRDLGIGIANLDSLVFHTE